MAGMTLEVRYGRSAPGTGLGGGPDQVLALHHLCLLRLPLPLKLTLLLLYYPHLPLQLSSFSFLRFLQLLLLQKPCNFCQRQAFILLLFLPQPGAQMTACPQLAASPTQQAFTMAAPHLAWLRDGVALSRLWGKVWSICIEEQSLAGGVGTLNALVCRDGCKDLLLIVALKLFHTERNNTLV